MKSGCWAADLGDCDGKLSAEHIFSEALWSGPSVIASGGPWGNGKAIGVSSLTSKILCVRHNSGLSIVDTAGGLAFVTIRRTIALANARKGISPRRWMAVCFTVDGPLLERWFLKTAINATVLLDRTAGWAVDETTGRPPKALVEMAYGVRPVERPFGLYAAARVGDGIDSQDRVSCHPLTDATGRIAAALFGFRGFNFLLNMRRQEPDFILTKDHGGGVVRTADDLLYRLNRINSDVGGFRSHYLDFSWPGQDFSHFAS